MRDKHNRMHFSNIFTFIYTHPQVICDLNEPQTRHTHWCKCIFLNFSQTPGTKLLVISGSSQLATLKDLATSSKVAHVIGFHSEPNQSGSVACRPDVLQSPNRFTNVCARVFVCVSGVWRGISSCIGLHIDFKHIKKLIISNRNRKNSGTRLCINPL